jgi:hypothetical protein
VRPISAWSRRRRHRRGGPSDAPVEPPSLAPADLAELEARLAAVEANHARDRDAHVAVRLRPLVDRRVPARVVEAVPALHVARIRFADGTAVFVQGSTPGDVAVLATWIRARSVPAAACSTDAGGTHLLFRSSTRAPDVCLRVTGVDQPA